MPEPRTHYQLSFTARQAMVFFVVCLAALGLSYFFGLMTGLSDRPGTAAARVTPARTASPVPSAAAAPAPEGPFDAPEAGSRTRIAGEAPAVAGAAAEGTPVEGTPPAVLQTFEDGGAEEPTPAAAVAAKTPVPAAVPEASGLWIQVASLTSSGEADALVRRLRRRGYHARIFPAAASPRGRVLRIRVGPYRTEEEASRAAEKLKRQEKIRQTWVVREGR